MRRITDQGLRVTTGANEQELFALIDLLADKDPTVRARLIPHLLKHGDHAITALVNSNRTGSHAIHIADALTQVRQTNTFAALDKYGQAGSDAPVEDGALLIAQLINPDLDPSPVRATLDDLASSAPTLVHHNDPNTSLAAFAVYMRKTCEFSGNTLNYTDPANSLIDRVLDRRVGLPITLCVIYLAIASRLDLPLEGIGLPGHFVVRQPGIKDLGYLDPFNQSQPINESSCREIVERLGFTMGQGDLVASSPQETTARITRNLVMAYRKDSNKALEHVVLRAHRHLDPTR